MPPRLRFALLAAASFIPAFAHAGESVSRPGVLHLSLDDAIRMALAKNFTIEVSRFEPKIARENVTSELGVFDPLFSAELSAGENTATTVFETIFDTRRNFILGASHLKKTTILQTGGVRLGLGGTTPLGTRYDIHADALVESGTSNFFDERFNTTVGTSLTQPLLRGAGTAANLRGVRIARNNALVSEWALRDTAINEVTQAVFVFNELHLAQQNLDVAASSRALAQQTLNDNIKRAEIGVMSPLNITTARAEVAARQEAVILAQRDIKDNENLLKQLVTADLEPMLGVQVEIDIPPSPAFRADVHAGLVDAMNFRPDYQQAILELERRHINLAFAKNQSLPQLDLKASLDLVGFDNDFGTSLNRTGRPDRTVWSVGAIFSVPIPNREARGAENAARFTAAQGLVNLKKLEQDIVVKVDNASGQVITSRERIVSNAEATKLAKESLDAGEERLRAGTGTTFEVLELQTKMRDAQFAELRARADYNKAVNEYYRQTGVTLRVYRVTVDK